MYSDIGRPSIPPEQLLRALIVQSLYTVRSERLHGSDPRRTVQQMGVEEVLTAPRCPWQNPFVERVIGSLRRECLDHVIVLNERSLQRHLQRYLAYYHDWRTHLSLEKDAPVPRVTQPPACGTIVSVHMSAVCITITNVAPPELALRAASLGRTRRLSWPSCAARRLGPPTDMANQALPTVTDINDSTGHTSPREGRSLRGRAMKAVCAY